MFWGVRVLADAKSRRPLSPGDWKLSVEAFKSIPPNWKMSVDLLASEWNCWQASGNGSTNCSYSGYYFVVAAAFEIGPQLEFCRDV